MTIKEMRELLNVSRAEFSRRYGIPVRTLESWETDSDVNRRSAPEWAVNLLGRAVKEDHNMLMNVTAYINTLREQYGSDIATDPTISNGVIGFTLQPDDPVQGTEFEVLPDGQYRNKCIAPGCTWTDWRSGFNFPDDEIEIGLE